jgi:LCP family protein required for cell wall assembly
MNFKKRRIRTHTNSFHHLSSTAQPQTSPAEPAGLQDSDTKPVISGKNSRHSRYANFLPVIAGMIIIFGLFWITMGIIKSLDLGSLVFSFGKELKKDSHKQTNFLLVGIGGGEHDGSNLTDTIILASLSEKNHTVKMLSLPRDLYIDDKQTGGQRINKVYDTYLNKYHNSSRALDKLAETVTNLTSIPINYTVKIDFGGFVKIVDALGGVTVNVEKNIYDPYYPKGETDKYETFSIKAGLQKLDGETALKYARSRKTTSDFDRARRQQLLLSAIKEQALNMNILTDPGKIQALYNSVADSLETSLSVAEIIELAKISKDINRENIISNVLSDDLTSCGGLLYTPVRDYFGGAAVLLPAGNKLEEIQRFSQNYFYSDIDSTLEIQVLNGTKVSGLAYDYLNRISRDCLNVVYFGNAAQRDLTKSTIYYLPQTLPDGRKQVPLDLEIIKQIIDAPLVEGIPEEYLQGEKRMNSKIVVEIGADYKKVTSEDAFDKLLYMTPLEPEETTTSAETGAERPLNSGTGSSGTTSSAATGTSTPSSSVSSGTTTGSASSVSTPATTNTP